MVMGLLLKYIKSCKCCDTCAVKFTKEWENEELNQDLDGNIVVEVTDDKITSEEEKNLWWYRTMEWAKNA